MGNSKVKSSPFTHDMRNCLVPLGITEVLLDGMVDTLRGTEKHHKAREGLDKVKKGADKLVSVRNNLLVLIDQCLACVKKAKREHIKEEIDIFSLVEETVDEVSCHKNLKSKEVKMNVEGQIQKGYFMDIVLGW